MLESEEAANAARDPQEQAAETAPGGSSNQWYWLALGVVAVMFVVYYVSGGASHSADEYVSQSLQLFNERKYSEAVTAAQAALKVDPKSALAYNNLAVSYQGLRQYDRAIEAAQAALRIDPSMQIARNNLAAILREQQGALAIADPKTAEEWLSRSLALYQAQKFEECLTAARQAVALKPEMAEAHNNISACAAGLRKWDEAIISARTALQLRPDFQVAKNNLSVAVELLAAESKKKAK